MIFNNEITSLILSPYIILYDIIIIPKDHELRQLGELVDFSFVYDMLKEIYTLDNDRPGYQPQVWMEGQKYFGDTILNGMLPNDNLEIFDITKKNHQKKKYKNYVNSSIWWSCGTQSDIIPCPE